MCVCVCLIHTHTHTHTHREWETLGPQRVKPSFKEALVLDTNHGDVTSMTWALPSRRSKAARVRRERHGTRWAQNLAKKKSLRIVDIPGH